MSRFRPALLSTLFAEGPDAGLGAALAGAGCAGAPAGVQRFAFELDGLPPGAKRRRRRRCGSRRWPASEAIEVAFRLD